MRIVAATTKPLDANKLKLIEFLSLPKACRPMPLKRFAAEVLGVSEPTIHAWKKSPEVVLSVRKTIEQRFINDIPDVLLALRDNALAGDPKAAKLFLEYIENSPRNVVSLKEKKSIDEVDQEIENLTRKFYPANP